MIASLLTINLVRLLKRWFVVVSYSACVKLCDYCKVKHGSFYLDIFKLKEVLFHRNISLILFLVNSNLFYSFIFLISKCLIVLCIILQIHLGFENIVFITVVAAKKKMRKYISFSRILPLLLILGTYYTLFGC